VVVALVGALAAALLGVRAGLAAMAIAAVYPPLIAAGATLMSEALFVAFVLGAVLAALRGRRVGWALAAGALAGLAILTRANGAVLLLPLVLALWGRPWRSRAALAAPVACLAAAALVVAPWSVRNLVVLDAPVLVSTSAPYTLAGAYNETARADERFPAAWRPPTLDPAYARLFDRTAGLDEVERGRELRGAVGDFVGAHPLYPLAATARNLERYAHLDGLELARLSAVSDGLPAWTGTAGAAGFAVVALGAAAAIVLGRARGVPPWVWLVPVVLLAGVAPVVTAIRFRVPADPFLIVAAAGLARERA
jgi:4-amino-4-deoxy-L-arabinose transferase-like glycosyltransferase